MTRVLIIEDDASMAAEMGDALKAVGFDRVIVGDGLVGRAKLRFDRFDACVLDLDLPALDGWNLLEDAARDALATTPIIAISTYGTDQERARAFELGAEDFLGGQFSMNELRTRVSAAVRRLARTSEPLRTDELIIEELRIDAKNVQAYVDGESANLTPTEFKLLYTLAVERGRVLSRDDLLQRVWGRRPLETRDRTVDVYVRKLRQKIDQRASTHTFVSTRYGVGYKLEPEPKASTAA